MSTPRTYIIIDLKSFYASVECVERGLDPLTARLVVADPERSEKTICLAITPAMKKLGIRNRCRLYEIPSFVQYITAVPRMQLYIDYSANIYAIYLRYFAKEDIFVYSIDEAFIDISPYLQLYKAAPKELARRVMQEILRETGITATCGIGSNLYLAKIALDIMAKHSPDFIGCLADEAVFREKLWQHRPITDFWRISLGTARRLESRGIYTMEQVAHCPEPLLYKIFGVDAEILIDHAWGREPVTLADIKAYTPRTRSVSNGQVLPRDYNFDEGLLALKEMSDLLCLDLVDRGLVTDSVTLFIGYGYMHDAYPPVRATAHLPELTSSTSQITARLTELYISHLDRHRAVRRICLTANHVVSEACMQLDLFAPKSDEREHTRQQTINAIKKRFGKNAIFRGMDLLAAATTRERNEQIGGHKSGKPG